MDGGSTRGNAEIEVVRLTPELRNQATDVLVEAFKTEETTNYHVDMKRPSAPRRMRIVDDIFMRLYLEADRPIFVAVRDGRVTGVGMVLDPRKPIDKRRAAALVLPNLPQILALFGRRPVRSLRVLNAAKHPKGLTKPFFTFEALGVHPDYQGQGVGGALMREAQALLHGEKAISGIYLNTGSEKNRGFYESLGYDTLRIDDLGAVKVYHMFWQSPAFG